MASTPEETLKRRAKRAYEVSRVRIGCTWAAVAMGTALFGALVTQDLFRCVALGLVASVMTVWFVWHGRALGRGVVPGLAMGAAAMLLALVGQLCIDELGGNLLACILPSAIGGFAIGTVGGRISTSPRGVEVLTTWAAVAATGAPLALIGCIGLGIGGALGFAAGLAVGAVPAVLRAAAPT